MKAWIWIVILVLLLVVGCQSQQKPIRGTLRPANPQWVQEFGDNNSTAFAYNIRVLMEITRMHEEAIKELQASDPNN